MEHRLSELHSSIRDKQRALKQISKSYSIFVIEAKTGDNKALEDFFSQVEFCMSLIDEKDKWTLHNFELSVRQGVYLTHEDYFYKVRDAILASIAEDKQKIDKLTSSKFAYFCLLIKSFFNRKLVLQVSEDVKSRKHTEDKGSK